LIQEETLLSILEVLVLQITLIIVAVVKTDIGGFYNGAIYVYTINE
jgi:hypothetical protein